MVGVVVGFTVGFVVGVVEGFTAGFVVGAVVGFAVGFVVGTAVGFVEEGSVAVVASVATVDSSVTSVAAVDSAVGSALGAVVATVVGEVPFCSVFFLPQAARERQRTNARVKESAFFIILPLSNKKCAAEAAHEKHSLLLAPHKFNILLEKVKLGERVFTIRIKTFSPKEYDINLCGRNIVAVTFKKCKAFLSKKPRLKARLKKDG